MEVTGLTLRQLEAEFIAPTEEGFRRLESKEGAQGLMFLCPVCYAANGGEVGTHMVICWEPSVPLEITPAPGRWNMTGFGIDDLTLVAGSSSVKLQGSCNAHFFVRNGAIVNC